MKVTLALFDSWHASKHCLLRGLLAFVFLAVLNVVWYALTKKIVYDNHFKVNSRYWMLLLSFLLLSCALAVLQPTKWSEALVYSTLVGFVVFGVCNTAIFSFFPMWGAKAMFIDWLWGTASTALVGWLVWLCTQNLN